MITLDLNKIVLVSFVLCLSLTNTSTASELTHKFGNPAFSKEGYSQHALSIEQLQYTRENDRIKDEKSALSQAEAEIVKAECKLSKYGDAPLTEIFPCEFRQSAGNAQLWSKNWNFEFLAGAH